MQVFRESDVLAEVVRARGHGVVELFDDRTGRLYRKEPFENFIAIPAQNYARKAAAHTFYWGTFRHNESGETYTDDVFAGYYIRSASSRVIGRPGTSHNRVLEALYCVNDTRVEDPTSECHLPGLKPTAFAPKLGYTQATAMIDEVRRGSQNETECRLGDALARFVFDWTTSTGNGTFQSLVWGGFDRAKDSENGGWLRSAWQYQSDWSAGSIENPNTTSSNFYASDGTTHTPHTSGLYGNSRSYIDPTDPDLIWIDNGQGQTGPRIRQHNRLTGALTAAPAISPSSASHALIGVDATHVYTGFWANGSFTSWAVNRYLKSTGALDNTWSFGIPASGYQAPTSSNRYSPMALDATNGKVYVGLYHEASSRHILWEHDAATGTKTRTIGHPLVSSTANGGIAADRGIVVWGTNGYAVVAKVPTSGAPGDITNIAQSDVIAVHDGWNYYQSIQLLPAFVGHPDWSDPDQYHLVASNDGSPPQGARRLEGLGARTLLATPVTKTSAQTMKITYQFDFV